MGLDWIETCAKPWKRKWDQGREALSQPNLFTEQSAETARSFRARMNDITSALPEIGKDLILQTAGQGIDILDGIYVIATAINPPEELVDALISASGCGLGTVIELYPKSATFDVALK